jgi:ATP-dependent NAD(P)H-hydrate dehydratase
MILCQMASNVSTYSGFDLVLAHVCEEKGSLRRVGGQGDILSGTVATFIAWTRLYNNGVFGQVEQSVDSLCAVIAASHVVKTASHQTFLDRGRHMLASDVLPSIPKAFQQHFADF